MKSKLKRSLFFILFLLFFSSLFLQSDEPQLIQIPVQKLKDLETLLQNINDYTMMLEKNLQNSAQKIERLQNNYEMQKEQLKFWKQELKNLSDVLQNYKNDIAKLKNSLKKAQGISENLTKRINRLLDTLDRSEQNIEEQRKLLTNLEKKIEQLENENTVVKIIAIVNGIIALIGWAVLLLQ